MGKKIISIIGCLFFAPCLCWIYATEKSLEEISVEFIKYKMEKIKKEKPNLTAKESKDYVDSLILNQVKVLEAKKQGIDTSFVYLNKVAEYSYQLADQRLSNKLKRNHRAKENADSIEFLQIYHLYQSIPQQASSQDFEEKGVLFDSIASQLHLNPSLFQGYVAHYSEVKDPVWVSQRQNVIEFDRNVMHLEVGEISKPFYTPAGIHLVKVIKKENLPKKKKKDSWGSMTCNEFNVFLSTIKETYDFSCPYGFPWERSLWNPDPNQVLFTLNRKEFTKSDFDYFSKNNQTTLNKQYMGFIIKTVLDEQYVGLTENDEAYEYDLMEFKQKLLLDELTRRELEKKVYRDPFGLAHFFELHKENYKLKLPRYQGILVFCSNRKVARNVKKLLRRNTPEKWESLLREEFGAVDNQFIKVEKGPFVIGSNACIDREVFKQGRYEAPDSHPRCVINGEVEWYPSSYLEVEEEVRIDYEKFLKKEWEKNLMANWENDFYGEVLKTVNKR